MSAWKNQRPIVSFRNAPGVHPFGICPRERDMSNQNRGAEGRPSQAVMDILRAAGSSGVCEALGRRNFMSLRPVYPNVSIVGPALTIHVPKGDHLMMHVAFEQANE